MLFSNSFYKPWSCFLRRGSLTLFPYSRTFDDEKCWGDWTGNRVCSGTLVESLVGRFQVKYRQIAGLQRGATSRQRAVNLLRVLPSTLGNTPWFDLSLILFRLRQLNGVEKGKAPSISPFRFLPQIMCCKEAQQAFMIYSSHWSLGATNNVRACDVALLRNSVELEPYLFRISSQDVPTTTTMISFSALHQLSREPWFSVAEL